MSSESLQRSSLARSGQYSLIFSVLAILGLDGCVGEEANTTSLGAEVAPICSKERGRGNVEGMPCKGIHTGLMALRKWIAPTVGGDWSQFVVAAGVGARGPDEWRTPSCENRDELRGMPTDADDQLFRLNEIGEMCYRFTGQATLYAYGLFGSEGHARAEWQLATRCYEGPNQKSGPNGLECDYSKYYSLCFDRDNGPASLDGKGHINGRECFYPKGMVPNCPLMRIEGVPQGNCYYYETNPKDAARVLSARAVSTADCFDAPPVGDGRGWDGEKTCIVKPSFPQTDTDTDTDTDTETPDEPGAVSTLANLRVDVYSRTALELFWDSATSPTGSRVKYRVYRGNERVADFDAKSLFQENLSPGTGYQYRVEAYDENGDVFQAATITAKTNP